MGAQRRCANQLSAVLLRVKSQEIQGAWLAQSVEHVTRDLGVGSLSLPSGVEIT